MPHASEPELDHFVSVKPTKENLEYADLVCLDFSKWDNGPEAIEALAEQLKYAMRTQGFFLIENHGVSTPTIDRQVDIGYNVLTKTSREEKQQKEAQIKQRGSYQGFKLRKFWTIENGVKDQIEQYNWNRDLSLFDHPSTFKPFIPEMQELNEYLHKVVLYRILTLFEVSLELPEGYLVERHKYETFDESWFRYMMYFREHEEGDMDKTGGLWLKGHQDFGTLTMLFSQPMISLQLKDHFTGKWRYVPYKPNAILINAGEFMEWWTGGYYKATIHRVHQPPEDQRNQDRCGLFYFIVPNENVPINTLLDVSPVLRAAGVERRFEPGTEPTSEMYVKARIGAYGQTSIFQKKKDGENGEVIGGVRTTATHIA